MEQKDLQSARAFGALLQQNAQASAFYDACTPEQRRAIRAQLHGIADPESMKAFVDHLPSATL